MQTRATDGRVPSQHVSESQGQEGGCGRQTRERHCDGGPQVPRRRCCPTAECVRNGCHKHQVRVCVLSDEHVKRGGLLVRHQHPALPSEGRGRLHRTDRCHVSDSWDSLHPGHTGPGDEDTRVCFSRSLLKNRANLSLNLACPLIS